MDIIYEAAGAATEELSAEVAAEVMAGIAMGLKGMWHKGADHRKYGVR